MHDHDKCGHPPETKLTFPSMDRELNIFYGQVPKLTSGDGGQHIAGIRRDRMQRLFDEARAAKAHLAERLNLDADGRAWIELPDPNFAIVVRDQRKLVDGTPRAQAYHDLRDYIITLANAADHSRRMGEAARAEKDAIAYRRLYADLYDSVTNYRSPLGEQFYTLRELFSNPEAYGKSTFHLTALSELATQFEDEGAGKKRRTVRTAKWLLKHRAAITQWSGREPDCDVNIALSRVMDVLASARSRVCVSVNPLDFILSATRHVCDFTSCHSLDGMHFHGNLSYALDGHTTLVFLTNDGTDDGFPWFKTGRAWLFVGDRDQILLGKLYGRAITDGVARTVVREIEMRLRPDAIWRVRNHTDVDWERMINIGGYGSDRGHSTYPGFLDTPLTRVAVPRDILLAGTVPVQDNEECEEDMESRRQRIKDVLPILVFPNPFCLDCGGEIDRANISEDCTESPFCGDCDGPRYVCSDCDDSLDAEDVYRNEDGTAFCESCYRERYFNCDRCSADHDRDDAQSVVTHFWDGYYQRMRLERQTWCERCVNRHASHCDLCDTSFIVNSTSDPAPLSRTHSGVIVCPRSDCQHEVSQCQECGEVFEPRREACPNQDDHEAATEAATTTNEEATSA